MRQGVGPVHQHRDAVAAAERGEFLHGQDLAGEVDHVAAQDHACARGDGLLEEPHDFGGILRGNRDPDLLQQDAVAPLSLAEGRDHAPVVLGRGEHFVSPLEVEPVLQDLQALGGVARQRDLLGIHIPLAGQAGAHSLPLGLEDLPHRVGGRLVGVVEVALHRLLHPARRRAYAPVVQVDQAAVDREGPGNAGPEVFVARNLARRAGPTAQVIGDLKSARGKAGGQEGQSGGGHGGHGDGSEKLAATGHVRVSCQVGHKLGSKHHMTPGGECHLCMAGRRQPWRRTRNIWSADGAILAASHRILKRSFIEIPPNSRGIRATLA